MEELAETEQKTAGDWLDEVKLAEKDKYYSKWIKRCEKIIKRYRDERAITDTVYTTKGKKSYNIFYSNVQTLAPAIYTRLPKPQVERRFKDADPVARAAASILERGLDYSIHDYDFDQTLTYCRDDYLLTGFGQAWIRYVPEYGPLLDEVGEEIIGEDGEPAQRLAYERVLCEYVHWKDFLHNPARTWDEVSWVARKVYLSKHELEELAGPEVAAKCSMNFAPEGVEERDPQSDAKDPRFKKAIVYELWDKTTKKVYWLSKGYNSGFLKVADDPLGLEHFFPCPKPMLGCTTSDSIVPIPDFAMYQDQAAELDEIATRKALILKAIRVVGIYDPSKQELARLLDEASENDMIPANDWAGFAAQGGIKGCVDFLPLETAIQTLIQLNDAEERVKNEIYEITGIADIIRGNSSPSETATAQQIKGQFATLRISDRQRAFQRFARDIIAIKGEIIAEKFQPQTIAAMVGVENLPPDQQAAFEQAVILLRDQVLRSYRIDIETDSTIAIDEQQDKAAATEFLTSVGGFMSQTAQTVGSDPIWGPVMAELLMMTVRKYHVARNVEGSIEQAIKQAIQTLQEQQLQPPPPDPEMEKLNMQMQIEQAKIQNDQSKIQAQAQIDMMKAQHQAELQAAQHALKQQEMTFKAQLEQAKAQAAMDLQAAKVFSDIQAKGMQLDESAQAETMRDIAPKHAAQPIPPIQIIHSPDGAMMKPPTKKVGRITRPDGTVSTIEIDEIPAINEAL